MKQFVDFTREKVDETFYDRLDKLVKDFNPSNDQPVQEDKTVKPVKVVNEVVNICKPVSNIQDNNKCMARIHCKGLGGQCSSQKSNGLDYCQTHYKSTLKSTNGLPSYGRIDQPRCKTRFDNMNPCRWKNFTPVNGTDFEADINNTIPEPEPTKCSKSNECPTFDELDETLNIGLEKLALDDKEKCSSPNYTQRNMDNPNNSPVYNDPCSEDKKNIIQIQGTTHTFPKKGNFQGIDYNFKMEDGIVCVYNNTDTHVGHVDTDDNNIIFEEDYEDQHNANISNEDDDFIKWE